MQPFYVVVIAHILELIVLPALRHLPNPSGDLLFPNPLSCSFGNPSLTSHPNLLLISILEVSFIHSKSVSAILVIHHILAVSCRVPSHHPDELAASLETNIANLKTINSDKNKLN